MIACVQNQHPDVLVVDEICHPADAQAAWICKHQRNVRLLAATAEAKGTLRDLVKIPYLNRLIGGVRKRGKFEHKSAPKSGRWDSAISLLRTTHWNADF